MFTAEIAENAETNSGVLPRSTVAKSMSIRWTQIFKEMAHERRAGPNTAGQRRRASISYSLRFRSS